MDRDPQAELILDNEAREACYRPYCLRCPRLVRMRKTAEPHYWRCECGAECDLREYAKARDK